MKYLMTLIVLGSCLSQASDSYPLTISVKQTKQVQFTHGANKSSNTDCSISGNNISCNTQDTSFNGIPGVSYLMLATASDGNTYMFGCDAAWRWSKCGGLMLHEFPARIDGGNLIVRAHSKNKEVDVKYSIFQVEVTQK